MTARLRENTGTGRRSGAWRAGGVLVLALSLALTGCGEGDGEGGEQATPGPAVRPGTGGQGTESFQELQQLQQGLRQVNRELQPIRQEAIQDSSLQQMRSRLVGIVNDAMSQVDPQSEQQRERLNELSRQVDSARQQQDSARARTLMQEARGLSRQLRQTRSQVMQRDSVSRMIENFRDSVRAVMARVDPRADSLLAVQDSLMQVRRQMMQQLQSRARQQQQQGRPRGGQQGQGGPGSSGGGG